MSELPFLGDGKMLLQYRDILLGQPGLMTIAVTIVIFILINLILAIIMIYKGIKMKYYTMILISGIFFAGVSAWGGVVFNLMYILITDTFPAWIWMAYFITQGGFLFLFHFIWIAGVVKLANIKKNKQKYLLIIVGIIIAMLEGSYWTVIVINSNLLTSVTNPFVITNVGLLGSVIFPFIVYYSPLNYFYLTFSLSFFTIAGSWIAINSYKSSDPRLKLKSKFLLVWVILVTVGSLMEIYRPYLIAIFLPSLNEMDAVILLSNIAKILLTIAVFCGYLGFMLPKRIEKVFLKT